MADDLQAAETPKQEKEVEDSPITAEGWIKELDRLVVRGSAAGLTPLKLMSRYYLQKGASLADRLFAALENRIEEEK